MRYILIITCAIINLLIVTEQTEIIIQDACMREQVAVGIVLPVEIMACQQAAQYSLP